MPAILRKTLKQGQSYERSNVKIEIVNYDPRWPDLYAEERERVEAVLGDLAESIEHIGSTSVPGCKISGPRSLRLCVISL